VALTTSFVEPAYLEPDASWCTPGGEPASPLANGGAFGAKTASLAPTAARELADHFGRAVRTVLRREDVVRLGPKRPPLAATAVFDPATGVVHVESTGPLAPPVVPLPFGATAEVVHTTRAVAGPPVSHACRAPWAEVAVLSHGAVRAAGIDPASRAAGRAALVALDSVMADPDGGVAGAGVELYDTGRVAAIDVRVAAGTVLDDVGVRSYCIGAVHMALGWVLSEGLTVDPESGAVLDLTIRSFGIVRPASMPRVHVEIVADDHPPCNGSDAVFVATAAALCDAVARATGAFPATFPARNTLRLT
jgi:CO/xanthine dehydrogenase Mo-binding subunit